MGSLLSYSLKVEHFRHKLSPIGFMLPVKVI